MDYNLEVSPRTLLLDSAGIKCLAELGALVVFEDAKLLSLVDTYAGVSSGALLALLLIIGYTTRNIIDLLEDTGLISFLIDIGLLPVVTKTYTKATSLSSEPIRRILVNLVLQKLGYIPSLTELHNLTGKVLVTVTYNDTDHLTELISYNSHPDVSVIDAVIYSMNLPYVNYQLLYRDKIYVDGTLGSPYPINLFDSSKVLGLYVRSHYIVQKRIISEAGAPALNDSICLYRVIEVLLDQRRQEAIAASSTKCTHLCIDLVIRAPSNYGDSQSDRIALIIAGYNKAHKLLAKSYSHPSVTTTKYDYPTVLGDRITTGDAVIAEFEELVIGQQ